jgi:enhancing lycopene biosynthesis protein 2
MTLKIALILAGCGAQDGTEITEAVSCLIAFNEAGISLDVYAPNRPSYSLVNHKTGQEDVHKSRNLMEEAARIARGNIKPLGELNVSSYDGVCIPGGFGAAKNLCDYATKEKDAKLKDDVREVLEAFLKEKKIIAALCIAPILLALLAKEKGLKDVKLTLGSIDGAVADCVKGWGVSPEACGVKEACMDFKNRFVTTPAYMYANATPYEILEGARALVQGIRELAQKE